MYSHILASGANVGDFAVPNTKSCEVISEYLHVVDISYDFTWPLDGNLGSAVNSATDEPRRQNLGVFSTRADVSNTSTSTECSTARTDCTHILGINCDNATLRDARSQPGGRGRNGLIQGWVGIPQCESTFGYIEGQAPRNYTTQQTNNLNELDGPDLNSRDAF
ncbi:hypothetical protein ANO14919_037430 [Xylariales sp. No.14919]|nr:hypothetical protein ANO14919_037430 [Xylariales sp. No.14919]